MPVCHLLADWLRIVGMGNCLVCQLPANARMHSTKWGRVGIRLTSASGMRDVPTLSRVVAARET